MIGPLSHLKEKAIDLRKRGASYNEIRKTLGIKSKGTLSYWFKNLELSPESERLLEANKKLAHKQGLFKANKDRTERIAKENQESFLLGKNLIKSISDRELMLIGASLYWGEGAKSEKISTGSLDFCNSDPMMVSVYIKFVRKILKVPEERIRSGIHLYPSTSVDEAKKFWSKVTDLPRDRFYIITQVSRASQGKRPFNVLPFGTITIRISSRVHFNKIKGMIKGISENLK